MLHPSEPSSWHCHGVLPALWRTALPMAVHFRQYSTKPTSSHSTSQGTIPTHDMLKPHAENTKTNDSQDATWQSPLQEQEEEQRRFRRQLSWAYKTSWVVNIALVFSKAYAFNISNSKAVLASLVDSMVDIASQVVISFTAKQAESRDPRFPVGQARMETIGVLGCAFIMSVSTGEVMYAACEDLWGGVMGGQLPVIETSPEMYAVLLAATAAKAFNWVQCRALAPRSDAAGALAEDHLNDIMSNMGALATTVLAKQVPGLWWVDPSGALLISAIIIYRWLSIVRIQVDKIVGRAAPPEFVEQLQRLADAHHDVMRVDSIKAYNFGPRFLVEMDVILPPDMEVHDITAELQMKLEALQEVERAFVHADYVARSEPEHVSDRMHKACPRT